MSSYAWFFLFHREFSVIVSQCYLEFLQTFLWQLEVVINKYVYNDRMCCVLYDINKLFHSTLIQKSDWTMDNQNESLKLSL